MNKYIICNFFSKKYFDLQCKAINIHIPNLLISKRLKDVDGSEIVEYKNNNGIIRIVNDYPIGIVYVEADYDIMPYFA